MRLVSTVPFLALVLAMAAAPVAAQQISPMTGTTASPPALPATPGAAAAVAPAASPSTAGAASGATTVQRGHRGRRTLKQRFEAANTSHDGKLTLEQARAGQMTRVVQRFDAIDTGKKGYVTLDDIHADNRAQRAARKAAK